MKKLIAISVLLAVFSGAALRAQDQYEGYLGLPGDNLNLYAVLKLFQESKTLEEFEKDLNDPDKRINNLDLNGDNMVDYIRVIDNVDRDVHNIVLQVPVNRWQNQDVAVFTVQKDLYGNVQIQLVGDEDLYGKNYIIEPIYDDNSYASQTPNPGYAGNYRYVGGNRVVLVTTTTYEVAAWPIIRFIYYPTYVPWHSCWYFGYYPTYWHAWHPYYWHAYWGYHSCWFPEYYSHYRMWGHHRYAHWNDYYHSRRVYSDYVRHNIESNHYRNTYSHPEQVRRGEEMFAKHNPDRYRAMSSNPSANRIERRSGYQPLNDRYSPGSGTVSRRNPSVMSDSRNNGSESQRNTISARRSDPSATVRSNSSSSGYNSNISGRRSDLPVNAKSNPASKGNNNSIGSRRSEQVTAMNTDRQASQVRQPVAVNRSYSGSAPSHRQESASSGRQVSVARGSSVPQQRQSNRVETARPSAPSHQAAAKSSERRSSESRSMSASSQNSKQASDSKGEGNSRRR